MGIRRWRQVHGWFTGYRRTLGTVVLILFVVISLTGILLNHRHDFAFVNSVRVPLWLLPGQYTERIEALSVAQADLPGGQLQGVPLRWVIIDLHTGDIFGSWGVFLYDLLSVVFIVLSVTGYYMMIILRKTRLSAKRRKR
ncbi:PepSY domain-containing protein [bacterium]|nr:PepSY domain-containing protein [bacterium]